jgi:hypothetical protein
MFINNLFLLNNMKSEKGNGDGHACESGCCCGPGKYGHGKHGYRFGIALVIIGLVLLLQSMGVFPGSVPIWSIVLIVFGLAVIIPKMKR